MALRLLSAAAAVWLIVVALFAATLRWTGPGRHPPRPASTSGLARSLNAAEPDDRHWRWSVTHAQASQGALVVEAEVIDLADTLVSAQAIVGPVQARYSEVLVYVRRAGAPGRFASRRVQWTSASGYIETPLGDDP